MKKVQTAADWWKYGEGTDGCITMYYMPSGVRTERILWRNRRVYHDVLHAIRGQDRANIVKEQMGVSRCIACHQVSWQSEYCERKDGCITMYRMPSGVRTERITVLTHKWPLKAVTSLSLLWRVIYCQLKSTIWRSKFQMKLEFCWQDRLNTWSYTIYSRI